VLGIFSFFFSSVFFFSKSLNARGFQINKILHRNDMQIKSDVRWPDKQDVRWPDSKT
jgi:hypothetical protein